MHHTLVALVEDKPGVLNRVASLFRRRNFNIESLTVGHTDKPGVSRMTFVMEADEFTARRSQRSPVRPCASASFTKSGLLIGVAA